jgi:hypothetical protein
VSVRNHAGLAAEEGHPRQCPWCGQSRIRGVMPSPDGNRWYRCGACATTFFIHFVAAGRPGVKNERRGTDGPLN